MANPRTTIAALCLLAFVLATSLPAACANVDARRHVLATRTLMQGYASLTNLTKAVNTPTPANVPRAVDMTVAGNMTRMNSIMRTGAGRHLLATRTLMQGYASLTNLTKTGNMTKK
ncbi:hypothetical protein HaLaN_30819, partial [Haematococcus lacustris]